MDAKVEHPIQPLYKDAQGVVRFKANHIVCHLLDFGGIDMNKLALMDFPREDREQFAQLIGYSHTGFGELPYTSDEIYAAAYTMFDTVGSELDARLGAAREQITVVTGAANKAIRALAEAIGVTCMIWSKA